MSDSIKYTKIVYENCRNPECKQRDDQFSIKYLVEKSRTDNNVEVIIVEKGGKTHRPEDWRDPSKLAPPERKVKIEHPCPWCGFINTFYVSVDK